MKKPTHTNRKECLCGNEATISRKGGTENICKRCARLESNTRANSRARVGKDRNPHLLHTSVQIGCKAWLLKRGIASEPFVPVEW